MTDDDRRVGDRREAEDQVTTERRAGDRRSHGRRQAERVPLELWVEELSGRNTYFRCTGNISSGGVYFERSLPQPVGSVLTLKFSPPGEQEFVARGEVVNAQTDVLGMGVKFIDFDGDGEDRLRRFLERVHDERELDGEQEAGE